MARMCFAIVTQTFASPSRTLIAFVDRAGGLRGNGVGGRLPHGQTLSPSATSQSPDRTAVIPGVDENPAAAGSMASSGSTPQPRENRPNGWITVLHGELLIRVP